MESNEFSILLLLSIYHELVVLFIMLMIYAFFLDEIPEEAIIYAEHLIDESLISEEQLNEVDD